MPRPVDDWPADEIDGGDLPDYEVFVRWSDMDVLEHVNNVKFVEFTDNARRELVAAGHVPPHSHLAVCRIDFIAPAESRSDRMFVVNRWIDEVLYQEVKTVTPSGVRVHARVKSEIGDGGALSIDSRPGQDVLHRTRGTDGVDGIVSNASLIGVFQEARVAAISDRGPLEHHERIVVARSEVRTAKPLVIRQDPYLVHTTLDRMGGASLELTHQIRDGDEVLVDATVVTVGFDMRTGRSRRFTDTEREAVSLALPSLGTSGA